MSVKMFEFTVKNMRTGEVAHFIGQGETMNDAVKEGLKNCADTFRPSTSGAKRPEHGIAVTLPSGRHVSRTLKEFDGDEPFKPEAVAV